MEMDCHCYSGSGVRVSVLLPVKIEMEMEMEMEMDGESKIRKKRNGSRVSADNTRNGIELVRKWGSAIREVWESMDRPDRTGHIVLYRIALYLTGVSDSQSD